MERTEPSNKVTSMFSNIYVYIHLRLFIAISCNSDNVSNDNNDNDNDNGPKVAALYYYNRGSFVRNTRCCYIL